MNETNNKTPQPTDEEQRVAAMQMEQAAFPETASAVNAAAVPQIQPNQVPDKATLEGNIQLRKQELALAMKDPIKRVAVTNVQVEIGASGTYFNADLGKDLSDFAGNAQLKTGFSCLDQAQPLYPGLYVLGAISSLGKTSFIYQMADNIAASGTPVMYFSTEQSRLELFTKSLSRYIHMKSRHDATYKQYTAIDIRRGLAAGTRELKEQIDAYTTSVKDNMYIVECGFNMDVEELMMAVDIFMEATKKTPVVIVDYLQNLDFSEINGRRLTDTRQNVDHIVHALKTYQKKNNLVVVAICSLNRANYMLPVDFESFKESGGIEYTADVVWGLELSLLTEDRFEKRNETYNDSHGNVKVRPRETTLTEKREMVKAAKNAEIREIRLSVLKNRFGCSTSSYVFRYIPKYDTFVPCIVVNGILQADYPD